LKENENVKNAKSDENKQTLKRWTMDISLLDKNIRINANY